MQLLWSKRIAEQNPWEPQYAGIFCKLRGYAHFFYTTRQGPKVLAENADSAQSLCPDSAGRIIPLPNRWVLVENTEQKHLFFAEDLALDLTEMQFTDSPGQAATRLYHGERKPEKYYEEASFSFDEYRVSHKGSFGYQCHMDEAPIWTFKGQGYLYTEIYRWQDRLYFGTSGQGGYFYILDIQTGEAVTKIKTGGTEAIIRSGSDCFILRNDKSAKLLRIDLKSGSVREEIELPGRSCGYSRLRLIDGKIHAVTFEKKRDVLLHACWSCVEI